MAEVRRTYVVFDADKDRWAYEFLRGWTANSRIDFKFLDAHDLNVLTANAGEETVKRKLAERMKQAGQALVLVGESTRNLYRFVRWEIERAIDLELPIIVANLNKLRQYDANLCPPILRDYPAIHVAYGQAILAYAIEYFPARFRSNSRTWERAPRHYSDDHYRRIGAM